MAEETAAIESLRLSIAQARPGVFTPISNRTHET
jgi:hypothetical protein